MKHDKPRRGFTLITILFVIVLLFIYVVSLLSISRGIMNISSHERDYASSFSGAEAGLTRAIYEINENNYWPGNATNPMWGQGFLSWQPLSDGITQYEIKAYNNFSGTEDRKADSGDRVPVGSIQIVSTGRLAPNDSQSTIKTFLKPNAKIPACLAGGPIYIQGNLFSRGIMDIYSLRTSPESNISSGNTVNYATTETTGGELLVYGHITGSSVTLAGPASPMTTQNTSAPVYAVPTPPVDIDYNNCDINDPNAVLSELLSSLTDLDGNAPVKVGGAYEVEASKISSLPAGYYYIYRNNIRIIKNTVPDPNNPYSAWKLNNVKVYAVEGHIMDVPGGIKGEGLISATGIRNKPIYDPNNPGTFDPNNPACYEPNMPASITMSGLKKFDYASYPVERLIIYADGDINIKGASQVMDDSGLYNDYAKPNFENWENLLYKTIKQRYSTAAEIYEPVSLENFIRDVNVENILLGPPAPASGIGTPVINQMKKYLVKGESDYSPVLAAKNCKAIVTDSNLGTNPVNRFSKTALQDILYSIARDYPYVYGIIYSRGKLEIKGYVHIIGSIIENPSNTADPNSIIRTEDRKTVIITPCVNTCLSLSNTILKDPKFVPASYANETSGGTSMTAPTPTVTPTPKPTATPYSGGGGGGGGGCFTADTMVLTDKGEKKIKDIKAGDYVISTCGGEKFVKTRVDRLLVHEDNTDYYYIIKTAHSSVEVTDVHPFYTGNGEYKQVKDLQEGDYIYTSAGNKIVKELLLSKELVKLDHSITVYNLSLDKYSNHNYFAGKYLVYNGTSDWPYSADGNTLIKTDKGEKKIKDIKPGDYVISYKDDKFVKARVKVLMTQSDRINHYYRIKTSHSTVKGTAMYQIYTGNNGYRAIKDLKKGDYIYCAVNNNLVKEKILSKEVVKTDKLIHAYSIELDDNSNHCYFANNCLVHNTYALQEKI
ncbi:MAG: polymorphic toxin-type HINT domain-containing protein [Candidatus Eremiobacterota bacterium]